MDHPSSSLDDVVHQKARLGILSIAAGAKSVEFGFVQKELGLTAGNLSRHVSVLEQAGMVTVKKGHVGKRPRSWISLTRTGQIALISEIRSLRALLDQLKNAGDDFKSPDPPDGIG